MKQKIQNIFAGMNDYNCFACGPDHPFGLHMEFDYDPDTHTVSSLIRPGSLFDGFPGILHGGIQATLLDEIAFWGVLARHGKSGLTKDLQLNYRKKCPTDIPIRAVGSVGLIERHVAAVDVLLENPENQVVFTSGTVRYFIPPR